MENAIAASLRVYGDVQGVGFRMLVKRWATELELGGYVRNLPDGSVEILVEGSRSAIERFLERLRMEAPTQIVDIEIRYGTPRGFREFYIVP